MYSESICLEEADDLIQDHSAEVTAPISPLPGKIINVGGQTDTVRVFG